MYSKSYHTKANTSPPTFCFLASLSVNSPLFVEMIAIPSPPNTLGSSSAPAYTLSPGLEILLSPVMIFSFLSAPYFNVITIASPGQKNEQNSQKFINWYKGLDYKNITVLLDEKGEIIKRANVLGYPFNLLLDKDLNLIKAQPGHLNSDQIKQFVKE